MYDTCTNNGLSLNNEINIGIGKAFSNHIEWLKYYIKSENKLFMINVFLWHMIFDWYNDMFKLWKQKYFFYVVCIKVLCIEICKGWNYKTCLLPKPLFANLSSFYLQVIVYWYYFIHVDRSSRRVRGSKNC